MYRGGGGDRGRFDKRPKSSKPLAFKVLIFLRPCLAEGKVWSLMRLRAVAHPHVMAPSAGDHTFPPNILHQIFNKKS